jgi:hypothetical protein
MPEEVEILYHGRVGARPNLTTDLVPIFRNGIIFARVGIRAKREPLSLNLRLKEIRPGATRQSTALSPRHRTLVPLLRSQPPPRT